MGKPEPLQVLRAERADLCDEIRSAGPTKPTGTFITRLKRNETKLRRLADEDAERRAVETEAVRERNARHAAQRRAEDPDAPPRSSARSSPGLTARPRSATCSTWPTLA